MYSIGDIAKKTGISAYTLRFYEKSGVLPEPDRENGVRRYTEEDLRYIRFIHGLKQTGMSLDDIAAFTRDGCLLSLNEQDPQIDGILRKRIGMLEKHIRRLEEQTVHLEKIKAIAKEKADYYKEKLSERSSTEVFSTP